MKARIQAGTPRESMRSQRWLPAQAIAAFFAVLIFSSTAFAEASVVIKVRAKAGTPPDGKVTLTARKGEGSFSCKTSAGTCRIAGLPGGAYWVDFVPAKGKPANRRPVMIPPKGEVTLYVAASQ